MSDSPPASSTKDDSNARAAQSPGEPGKVVHVRRGSNATDGPMSSETFDLGLDLVSDALDGGNSLRVAGQRRSFGGQDEPGKLDVMVLGDPGPLLEPGTSRSRSDGSVRVEEDEIFASRQVVLGQEDLFELADAGIVAHAEDHDVICLTEAGERPLTRHGRVGDVEDHLVPLLELGQLQKKAFAERQPKWFEDWKSSRTDPSGNLQLAHSGEGVSSEVPSDRRLIEVGGGSANVLQRHAQSLCKRCDRDIATARKDGDRLEVEVGRDEFERSGRDGLRTMAGDVHLLGHSRGDDLEKLDRSGRMTEQRGETSVTQLGRAFKSVGKRTVQR